MACEVFKIVNKLSPEYIQDMISIKTSTYNFRGERKADIPRVNTTRYDLRSFRSEAPRIWNSGVCATSKALDQSDRGLCLSLECYVTIGLLPGCHLGSEPGGGGVRARLGLHVSECHIVGSHMPRL